MPSSVSYLLSLPRSGSTILGYWLNKIPGVYCPPEPWILLATSMFGSVFTHHPADGHLIKAATEEFFGDDRESFLYELLQVLYTRKLKNSGSHLFVDKTPRNYACLSLAYTQITEFPPVVLFRNPIAIAQSYLHTWNIDIPSLIRMRVESEAVYDFVLGSRWIADYARSKPAILIRYEDLQSGMEAIVTSIKSGWHMGELELMPDIKQAVKAEYASSSFGSKFIDSRPIASDFVNSFSVQDTTLLLSAVSNDYLSLGGYLPEVAVCGMDLARRAFESDYLPFISWSYKRRLQSEILNS